MPNLTSLIRLLRPGNVGITLLSVVLGGVLALDRTALGSASLWLAGLAAALVAAGGNSVNDACDAPIDRINRPRRPVASGAVSARAAYAWGILLQAVGVALGWALDARLGLFALSVAILLTVYNLWLKRAPLAGNVIVSGCAAATLLYGALAVQRTSAGLIPLAFAFLAHLGREIVKDCQDARGDREAGARTLPLTIGGAAAQRIAAAVMFLLALAVPLPWYMDIYGLPYLVIASATAVLPLLVMGIILQRELSERDLGKVSRILKLVMLGGLAALYAG